MIGELIDSSAKLLDETVPGLTEIVNVAARGVVAAREVRTIPPACSQSSVMTLKR